MRNSKHLLWPIQTPGMLNSAVVGSLKGELTARGLNSGIAIPDRVWDFNAADILMQGLGTLDVQKRHRRVNRKRSALRLIRYGWLRYKRGVTIPSTLAERADEQRYSF